MEWTPDEIIRLIGVLGVAVPAWGACIVGIINAWQRYQSDKASRATLSQLGANLGVNTTLTSTAAANAKVAADASTYLGESIKASTDEIKVALVKCVEQHAGIAEAVKAAMAEVKNGGSKPPQV